MAAPLALMVVLEVVETVGVRGTEAGVEDGGPENGDEEGSSLLEAI